MKNKKILRPYQRNGVIYGLKTQHPFLAWEMRLGKTLTCIRTIKIQYGIKKILVVGPFSAIHSWIEELQDEGENHIFLYGTREVRVNQLKEALDYDSGRLWVLINKEGHFALPEIAGENWDAVVWDESIFIANEKAQTTQFYVKHFRTIKHRWALCGTPASETPLQWYNQLRWLDYNLVDKRGFYAFRNKFFDQDRFEWVINTDGEKYLTYKLDKYVSILKRQNVNLGGAKIREIKYVELPSALRKPYNELVEFFRFTYNKETHGSIYATQQYLWLRKFCTGFNQELHIEYTHKCDVLHEILQTELKNEPVVVWCHFLDDVFGLYHYLRKRKYKVQFITGLDKVHIREERRQQFQNGKIQVLIILTQTMSFSAKLSKAAALIYFSHNPSGKIRIQSEDRHLKPESKDSLLIIDLICIDTIEEKILQGYDKRLIKSAGVDWMLRAIQGRIIK